MYNELEKYFMWSITILVFSGFIDIHYPNQHYILIPILIYNVIMLLPLCWTLRKQNRERRKRN